MKSPEESFRQTASPSTSESNVIGKWTPERIKLLMSVCFEHEAAGMEFNRTGWNTVHQHILCIDEEFPFGCDKIITKFTNLLKTYKRNKQNSQMGRGRISWEYYEEFDSFYEPKAFVRALRKNISDSLNAEKDAFKEASITSSNKKGRKRSADIVEFLQSDEEIDAKRKEYFKNLESEKTKLNYSEK